MSQHICKCGKAFNQRQSVIAHKRWCLIHRDGVLPKGIGKDTWNKGKTKETDERLKKAGQKISTSKTGKPGRKLSDREKQNLSAIMSERLVKGYADGTRDQVGGYCKWFEVDGVKVQGTWEKRVALILSKWKLSGKIKHWERCTRRIPYELDGKFRIYQPDFAVINNDDSEFILEIKGRKSLVDDLKWSAARQYFDLVVWRLSDIKRHEVE